METIGPIVVALGGPDPGRKVIPAFYFFFFFFFIFFFFIIIIF